MNAEGPQLVVVDPVTARGDVPTAQVTLLDTAHFARVEEVDAIAEPVDGFLHVEHANEVAAPGDGRCAT